MLSWTFGMGKWTRFFNDSSFVIQFGPKDLKSSTFDRPHSPLKNKAIMALIDKLARMIKIKVIFLYRL